MGVFGFIWPAAAASASAGGVLTNLLDWHWIFLVNLPVGAACSSSLRLLPAAPAGAERHVDVTGAVTVTPA